ncbi:MAG: hypothetical protein ABEJ34_02590 [Haloferacaceae archaeon]
MRAREWAIAERFRTPADYGIPEVPAWRVCRGERGGLAFADAADDPFISAERPVEVRR